MRWGRMSWLTVAMWAIGALNSDASAGTITGRVSASGVKDARDTVVYLDTRNDHTFVPPPAHAKMDQLNKEFLPHVLPILVGTTVDFHNSDEVAHDVFSPDKAVAPNLKFNPWLKGGFRSYAFTTLGVAALLCHIHTEMSAYVIVLETPYFAVSDATGQFTIPDVPPGAYVLHTWHEKLTPVSQPVAVHGDELIEVRIELK